MNDDERTQIDSWVERLSAALELSGTNFDVDEILGLAGVAARAVVRPAAPLTTFLVGYAAGLAAAAGTDPAQAMHEHIATAVELSKP
jgi:hypothetical protein